MFGCFKKKQLSKKVLLLSGIPDNKEHFMELVGREKSDFLRSLRDLYGVVEIEKLWDCYSNTAKVLQSTFRSVEARGGVVIRNFSLQDLNCMGGYDIVVILTHHSDDSDEIEFSGEMVRTMDFVSAIPNELHVIFDLTSCYSAYLIPKVKGHVPMSKIIGVDCRTKLTFRLFLLEKVIERMAKDPTCGYIDALKGVLAMLPTSGGKMSVEDATPDVHLGGKLRSTVYAPKKVCRGNDFIVSIFLHKPEESDEVEIIAKSMDEDAQERVSKPLSAKIRKGDRVDFRLSVSDQLSKDFGIDKQTKGIVWEGDINNVEFVVSVSKECQASDFIGCIKICVNKEPVGDMAFKTSVVSDLKPCSECANFEFVPFNRQTEMDEANVALLKRLSERIAYLSEQKGDVKDSSSKGELCELEMCRRCKELLEASRERTPNNIFKVFISSTSDMKQFREIIRERVESCGMYPDMYENWGQGNDYPRDVCCRHVLQSDIFVCILGAKYGFVEPIWDKSMTEIEYRIAESAGLPILIYVIANYKEEMEKLENEDRQKSVRQEHFIEEVKNKRMVGMFPNDLGLSLLANSELLTVKHKLQS